jgi:hypothetical protein
MLCPQSGRKQRFRRRAAGPEAFGRDRTDRNDATVASLDVHYYWLIERHRMPFWPAPRFRVDGLCLISL